MQNITDFNSNIPHHIAAARRNSKQCINCGSPEKNVEINSCGDWKCNLICKRIAQWSKEVCGHMTKIWAPPQHGGNV